MSAHWWVEPGPEISGCEPVGILVLFPVHGCMRLGLGPSGGQGQVSGQLEAQGVLEHLACWLVGLCPCLASCLAWGVPGLVPTSWYVGPGPGTNKLEGGFQNGVRQHQCSHANMNPPKWLLPAPCPQHESQLPPASLGDSPMSVSGSDPGSFQITVSALGLGACKILCKPFKNGVSLSHNPLALPKVSPNDFQRQMFWGLFFLVQVPRAGEANVRIGPLLLGKNLCNCNYLHVCESSIYGHGS